MTDEKQTSVIEKIKKLFAMAQRHKNNDGSSNEAEATVAMSRAQELLAKYNLDMAMIQDSPEQQVTNTATGKREKVKVKRSAMYKWQQHLWKALAEANFCWHWVVDTTEFRWGKDRRVKRHVILGSEANVVIVQMMGDYISETIERLVLENYSKAESLSSSANAWREGCAARLIERIQERAEEMKRKGFTSEGSSCTALAVQDLHEKEYAANYDAQYGAGAYARMKKQQAEYEAGRAAREKRWADERKRRQEEEARRLAGETPEQREKREKAEAKEKAKEAAASARYWERQQRKAYRESVRRARRDMVAYAKGSSAAENINLNSQVLSGKPKAGFQ